MESTCYELPSSSRSARYAQGQLVPKQTQARKTSRIFKAKRPSGVETGWWASDAFCGDRYRDLDVHVRLAIGDFTDQADFVIHQALDTGNRCGPVDEIAEGPDDIIDAEIVDEPIRVKVKNEKL